MKHKFIKWIKFDPDDSSTYPDDLSKSYELAGQYRGSSILYTGTGVEIINYVKTLVKHGDKSKWFLRLWNEPK